MNQLSQIFMINRLTQLAFLLACAENGLTGHVF